MSSSSDDRPSESPQIFAGRYKIISKIGEGGAGEVYKAYDQTLKRHLAIKMLHSMKKDEKRLLRFQREAKAASKLYHPGLLEVFDFGCADDGTPYLVMELVDGRPLSAVLAEASHLPVKAALELAIHIADAMQHAHEHKVIHRDLKPGNILCLDGKNSFAVKVIDFGLATVMESESAGKTLTPRHAIAGSPNYMSPEQIEHKALDQRSDIYSLGCILYELIAGAPPFQSDSVMETLEKQIKTGAPPLTQIDPELPVDDVLQKSIDKMLAKDPAERFASMKDVSQTLTRCLSRLPVETAIVEHADDRSQSEVLSKVGMGITLDMRKDGSAPEGSLDGSTRSNWVRNLVIAGGGITIVAIVAVLVFSGHPEEREESLAERAHKTLTEKASSADLDALVDFQKAPQKGDNSTKVRIDVDPFSEQQLKDVLSRNSQVQSLEIYGVQTFTDQMLAQVGRLRSLRSLEIMMCPRITDRGVAYLKELPLHILQLRYLNLTDKSADHIAQIRTLRELWFSHNPQISVKTIQPLTGLPLLYLVGPGDTQIKGKDYQQFKNLKHLRVLAFEGSAVSDEDARNIRDLKFLQGIWLTRGTISDKGLSYFVDLPELKLLRVRQAKKVSPRAIEWFRARTTPRCIVESDYVVEPVRIDPR